ncbi:hypothetical protein FM076_17315 [Streptomyces albus subsp. chlorinus]|uniref:hypothetical protein n=1 Tax=Streptomyces albus TaxID=1888 RepID=UPI00156F870D|nr:hypothetical protein [Streptomyces albus]NSC22833.1 hypothetical protein [Streptomyces albus subsp. chlorinus]
MNRPLRIALLAVLAVVLIAVGAVGGALSKGEDGKAPKKFSDLSGDTTCWAPGSVLDRVVPASHYADRWKRLTRAEFGYNAQCGITVDGKQVLRVSVEQRNAAHKLDRVGTGPGHGETKRVPGFAQGWSSQDAVGVVVPCTKDTGDDDATNLYVKAQAWRKTYGTLRADMVRIAQEAVKAHRTAACVSAPALDKLD